MALKLKQLNPPHYFKIKVKVNEIFYIFAFKLEILTIFVNPFFASVMFRLFLKFLF